jgi:hypothetical protein
VVSDIPTLLLSGRFDPITPPTFAETVAATLGRAYVYTFPNTSHGAFWSSPCANQIIFDFLENPYETPDASCLPDEPTQLDIPTPQSVIMTPAVWRVLEQLNRGAIGRIGLFLLALLGLCSFLIVWPLLFLIHRLGWLPARAKQPGPVIRWGAPLLILLTIGVGGLFILGLIVLVMTVDLSTLAVGIPWLAAPLFILPLLLVPLTAGMLIVMVTVWVRGYWSIWWRLYYSLLVLMALVFTGILAQWEMMTVFL